MVPEMNWVSEYFFGWDSGNKRAMLNRHTHMHKMGGGLLKCLVQHIEHGQKKKAGGIKEIN